MRLVFVRMIDLGELTIRFSDFFIRGVGRDVEKRVEFSVGRSGVFFFHVWEKGIQDRGLGFLQKRKKGGEVELGSIARLLQWRAEGDD